MERKGESPLSCELNQRICNKIGAKAFEGCWGFPHLYRILSSEIPDGWAKTPYIRRLAVVNGPFPLAAKGCAGGRLWVCPPSIPEEGETMGRDGVVREQITGEADPCRRPYRGQNREGMERAGEKHRMCRRVGST